ncbi:DENN domain-containing protein 5B-like isoform X2 [Stigmatopora argus]
MSTTGAATGSASCRFAHYFVVCGLDPETGLEPDDGAGESFEQSPIQRSFKSRVLVHYPESTERNPLDKDAVNMLCMPRGLSFSTRAELPEPRFHSFTLGSEDGSRSYGFVHTFYEEVAGPRIVSAMQTLQRMHHVERHSAPSSCASSAASSPSASSTDSLASSSDESDGDSAAAGGTGFDPARDTLYASKALCLLTPLPFLGASRHFLSQLHRAAASRTAPPLPLESYIHNILYEVPLPPPGRSLRFHGVQGPILCQRPGPGELPLGEYPLGEAFSLLGVENMVRLLTCSLLETQILLYSQDCQRLMTVAEGISTLLFPFQWQHIYLPIISTPLHHLLDAPVPFLMGIQRRDGIPRAALHLPHEANLCFVDIDGHCADFPEGLPAFPEQAELIRELGEILREGGALTKATSTSSRLSSLVLEDLMEDRRNGNLGGDELEVLERLQALARGCGGDQPPGPDRTPGCVWKEEEEALAVAKSNLRLREVFAGRFSAMFGRYEDFVVHGAHDLDSWMSNREGTPCFDKGAFLAAQPVTHLHFLSRFLETSMFSSFADGKAISRWAEREPLQQLFDTRLEKERLARTEPTDCPGGRYGKYATIFDSAQSIERRHLKADHTAIHPHLLDMKIGQGRHQPGYFPKLQADVLSHSPNTNNLPLHSGNQRRSSRVMASRKSNARKSSSAAELAGPDAEQRQHSLARKPLNQLKFLDLSPQVIAQIHRDFVQGLLSEYRLKTKRMLMERMGKESVEAAQGEANITGLQENTLIHGLCDLLERTWGHGLQMKQGKSALWSHLLHYNAALEKKEVPAESPGTEQRACEDGVMLLRGSLLQDMRFIQTMSEGLSEVGQARAWISLALEKKMLSQHLKELLTNQELLKQLYKPHAFLLCEEEREQFLFHLLSLNTVDYLCFTHTFPSISIPYRVAIIPMKKLSIAMATVNPWVCVSGEMGDSGVRQIPKNTQEIIFECKNLGRLSTLQLGQENSGLLAKCLIDCVMVYNEITGHTYKFPCGRWLGKGVGDGSLERVLIGQVVSPGGEEDSGRWTGTPPELASPSQGVRAVLGSLANRTRVISVEVHEDMREAANNLVKHFHKPEQERGNLTALLCGEGGLVPSLEKFLLHGFKISRLFQRNVFVWDFVEKAVVSMETAEEPGNPPGSMLIKDPPCELLCHYVNSISASPRNIGKEGKFQLLVCLGVRDRLLSQWLPLLAECPLTSRTYEDGALMRDRSAVGTLSRILHTLNEFAVTLESSLVKGVAL